MREALLNRRCTITRKSTSEISIGLEPKDEYESVATNQRIRITNNDMQEGQIDEGGWNSSSSNMGFMLTTADVQDNDLIIMDDNGDEYVVNHVDTSPGGKTDSHYELYLSLKDSVDNG